MIVRTGGMGEPGNPNSTACVQARGIYSAIEGYKPGFESALRSFGFTPILTDSGGYILDIFGCPDVWVHMINVTLAEIPSWEGNSLVVGLIDGSTGPIPSPKELARRFIAQAKFTLPIPMSACYGTGDPSCVEGDSDYTWATIQRQLAAEPARVTAQEAGRLTSDWVTVVSTPRTTRQITPATSVPVTTRQVTPATSIPTDTTSDDSTMGGTAEAKPWYESLMSGNTLLLVGAAVVAFMIFSSKGDSK